jgi:hypothetical protein
MLPDVKRIISELRAERQQIEMEILSVESSSGVEHRTASPCLAAPWTHQQESEVKQEQDFCDLLAEFEAAVLAGDGDIANYCASELKQIFRNRAAMAMPPVQSNTAAKQN